MAGFFGGGGKQTTVAQATPSYGPLANQMAGAASDAFNLYGRGPPTMYPGQYLAPQSPQTTGAVQGITDYTQGGVPQGLIQTGQNAASNIAGGGYNQFGTPYIQNTLAGGGNAGQYAQGLQG